MISTMVYNAQDPQKRKENRRGILFILSVLFTIMMFFSAISAFLIFVISASQENRLAVTFSCFLHFMFISIAVILFLAFLLFPTLGKQSMQVNFSDSKFTVRSMGPSEKIIIEICYQDVEKIYISALSRFPLWQRWVGGYSIYYEIRKETKNGKFYNYPKRIYRQFPKVYSLKEAEEIVCYIRKKAEESLVFKSDK